MLMHRTQVSVSILTLAITAMGIGLPAHAAILNGSFETPAAPGGAGFTNSITNWTTYGAAVYAGGGNTLGATTIGTTSGRTGLNGGAGSNTFRGTIAPADGTQVFIVNPNNIGESGVYQDFAGLTVGQWHTINFNAANDNGRINITGVVSVTQTDDTGKQGVWSARPQLTGQATMPAFTSQVFQATATTMRVRIGGTASAAGHAYLFDNVSVSGPVSASNTGVGRGVGNVLTNGNFENLQTNVATIQSNNGSDLSLGAGNGWTLRGTSSHDAVVGTVRYGAYFNGAPAKTDGYMAGGMQRTGHFYQDVVLAAGTYDLYWQDAARSGGGTAYNISLGSLGTIQSVTAGSILTSAWTDRSLTGIAIASSGTYRLQFTGTTTADATSFFDNISLVAVVPEPTSLGILALGGLALRRRRRA